MVLDGYSARVIREWYTHVGGAPTRLQESTRYVNYENFEYITPKKIKITEDAEKIYTEAMSYISDAFGKLLKIGIPKEDVAMILPLGMTTRVVDKRNLRNLIDMSRRRMCSRAYWEFTQLFKDICNALSAYSEEWKYIIETEMKPLCEYLGYCPEKKPCNRKKAS